MASAQRSRSKQVPVHLHTGSPPHVFVQESEHVGLPNAHAEIWKVVPLFGRAPDGWVDLQAMRFTELLQPRVQRFARRDRVVVRT